MLTIESLTSELGLKVAAGDGAAGESEIRWVHITELLDPTPWLSGGELLLTTGIRLENADKQRKFIRLLAEADVAGLGFGTGLRPRQDPEGAARGGGGGRLPRLRGSLRDALHRDHRSRFQPAGERAIRRALPRHRRKRASRAAGPAGWRPQRDRARDRCRRRRQLGGPGCARRGPRQRRAAAPRVPARRHPHRGAAARHRRGPLRAEPRGPPGEVARPSGVAAGGCGRGLAGGRPPFGRAR